MASRIASLEKSVAKAAEGGDTSQSPQEAFASNDSVMEYSALAAKQTSSSCAGDKLMKDVLVQNGSPSRYFDETLLSRIVAKESDIESAWTSPRTECLRQQSSPFNALGILSSPFVTGELHIFHPPKQVALKLWSIFVAHVDGQIGLKLLHVPTDEIIIYSTIDEPTKATFENLALCFAIYFASTVALNDSEAEAILELDMQTRLLDFKVGLEQAFAQGGILDRPTVTGVRALAIYLSALRLRNRGRGIWVLNGLAIRLAQSLGIHRNGEQLGLSPFESEIRRRLWWHLVWRESRAGEDYGLENAGNPPPVSGVSMCLNVDDADLDPTMDRLPIEKKGWTPMTFSLINIELAKAMRKLSSAIAPSSARHPPSEDFRVKVLKEARARIEERVAQCHSVVPQQRLTLHCSHFLLRKLDFVTRQQWVWLQHPISRQDLATDDDLIEALEILKPRDDGDDFLEPYSWIKQAYPQYHVTMYVLWHLCVKPHGPNVDRAWTAVDRVLNQELRSGLVDGPGSKLAVLTALKQKAESLRQGRRDLDQGQPNVHGNDESDMATMDRTGSLTLFTHLAGAINPAEASSDIGAHDWPPWATLIEDMYSDEVVSLGTF